MQNPFVSGYNGQNYQKIMRAPSFYCRQKTSIRNFIQYQISDFPNEFESHLPFLSFLNLCHCLKIFDELHRVLDFILQAYII